MKFFEDLHNSWIEYERRHIRGVQRLDDTLAWIVLALIVAMIIYFDSN